MNPFRKFDIYYIVTLLFLFLSAASNFLTASDIGWFAVMFFMLIVAISKKSITERNLKTIAIFSVVYLVFVGVRDVLINNLEMEFLVSDVLFLFKYIFLSFIFCIILRDKAIIYIVKVAKPLIIISIFLYFFQLIGLGDYIYKYSSALNLPNNLGTDGYTNCLFFTYCKYHEFRNSGFFWEPGAFACFLVIILLLNLLLNKFKFDRDNIIIVIALITTTSTTGYLALLLICFLVYRYRVPKINMWVVILIPLTLIIIINTPNLGDKISGTFESDMKDSRPHQLRILERYSRHQKSQTALNRFSSMIVIYNTFGADLILGVSNKYNVILNKTDDVNISNGVFDFMAKFGLVGFIFLVYKFSKFCKVYLARGELLMYCIIIFLIICTGEPVVFLPNILIFLFMTLEQSTSFKLRTNPDDDIPHLAMNERDNKD